METCSRVSFTISLALSDGLTTIFASSSSSFCLSRSSSSATSKLCLRRSKKWIPLSGEGGRRRTKTLRVWREINEHVTAVVDASFREEEDEEEDEEETEGLGGVVSDAAA